MATHERIWQCKIGGQVDDEKWEPGGEYTPQDHHFRSVVEKTWQELYGTEVQFTFSGFGAELTEPERAVVEDRLPTT